MTTLATSRNAAHKMVLRAKAQSGMRYRNVLLITAMVSATPSHAQTPPAAAPFTTINLNYVYAALLGFGSYSVGGLTADVYTLPLSETLRDAPYDGWALRVLLPIQLGLYNFNATYQGQSFSIKQQSFAVVPGIELQIPVTDRFAVKPFAQFGASYTFGGSSVGNPGSWIYLTGLRSVAQWRAGAYTISLGNGVVYAGDATIGPGPSENYLSLQIGMEIRRPLGFTLRGVRPELGFYVADYYYPTSLRFSRFLAPPLHVHNQNEIGFSIGSADPLKFLWLSNPRIGAGFVFGNGLKVWHVNFGFPF